MFLDFNACFSGKDFLIQESVQLLTDAQSKNNTQMNLFDTVVTINKYYLIAEYLEGGELFDRIVDKDSYTECEARDCCRRLFGALGYCHEKSICQLSF